MSEVLIDGLDIIHIKNPISSSAKYTGEQARSKVGRIFQVVCVAQWKRCYNSTLCPTVVRYCSYDLLGVLWVVLMYWNKSPESEETECLLVDTAVQQR